MGQGLDTREGLITLLDAAVLLLAMFPDEDTGDEEVHFSNSAGSRQEAALGAVRPATPRPVALAEDPPGAAMARLDLAGEFWTITYEGESFQLKDSTGLRHLARLLSQPGVDWHALDLAGGGTSARYDGEAVLDRHAKEEYRRRLEDLRAVLAEGEAWGDGERISRAREEMAFVADELGRAVGLGGRDRLAATNAERARVNVTRAIRTAIGKINEHDARLGSSLSACVRTGQFCSYTPSAHAPILWHVGARARRHAA